MAMLDPHSCADLSQGQVRAVQLELRVDFEKKILEGEATLILAEPSRGGPLDLDTRGLAIESVQLASDLGGDTQDRSGGGRADSGLALAFTLHAPPNGAEWMGERLRVELPKGAKSVVVRYRTSPDASALQWLEPAQTAGGVHPYLFSQCQAIHARAVVPLQDTPRARMTYAARLHVPRALKSRMSARSLGRSDSRFGAAWACDAFEMPQAIPPYLLALAVGDLAERAITKRSSVVAEPSQLDAAAWEFAEVGAMMDAAEKLFGPYAWERFDLLLMPPSFPYGGMENPRLTFLTPSLLAGDRSLANVVAHELAHAWTGNLVTNADANHFWLNEGFTVYAERRILEALSGRAASELHAAIGRHELEEAITDFAKTPELTRLRNDLVGTDPDVAYSQVPYEKGYLFLRALEESEGRAAFDRFLHAWIERHSFQSVTTDAFLTLVREQLPGVESRVPLLAWIDGAGIPEHAPRAESERWFEVKRSVESISRGELPTATQAASFTPAELLLLLQSLPASLTAETCAELDRLFALREKQSVELRCAFLCIAVRAAMPGADGRARELLLTTGRMKFLRPLYGALSARGETRQFARTLFAEASSRYHPIARAVLAPLVGA